MALATNRYCLFPDMPLTAAASALTPAITTTSLKQAAIFKAPAAGQIAKIHAKWGTVTGTSTATFALQDVNSSAVPDGTDDQTASTATPSSNAFFTVTFSSNRTVAANELVAFVVGALAIGTTFQLAINAPFIEHLTAWSATYNGSTWTNSSSAPAIAVEYSDGSIYPIPGIHPGTRSSVNISTSTSPSEIGLRFRTPFPMRIAGATWSLSMGTTSPFDVCLYDDAMSLLASGTRGTIRVNGVNFCSIWFGTPYTTTANTWYRLSLKPTSTNNVAAPYVDVSTNAHLAAYPGGTEFYYFSRASGVNTDLDTRRPMASLIVDQLDAGGGAIGGGNINGGLQ